MHNASTYIVQHTHVTVRCGSGSAYGASMINQPVAEVIALLGWDDFPKLHLHFFWVFYSIYKSYTVAKAYAVCVGDDGRLAVHITHNQVGTLSADSRQLQQVGHIVRHKTAKIIAKHSHAGTYITCLTLSQAAWTYNFFYVGNISIGESLDGRIFFEQIHHDYIYAGISALGCEPD